MKKLRKQFESVKNSVEIEGLIVTPTIEDLVLREAMGEITSEEFFRQARIISEQV